MGDKSYTLLELHTHDGIQLGPATLGEGDETDDERTTGTRSEESATVDVETTESGGSTVRRLLGAVAAVGVLVLLARTGRRLLGDAEDVDLDLDVDEDLVEADLSDD